LDYSDSLISIIQTDITVTHNHITTLLHNITMPPYQRFLLPPRRIPVRLRTGWMRAWCHEGVREWYRRIKHEF